MSFPDGRKLVGAPNTRVWYFWNILVNVVRHLCISFLGGVSFGLFIARCAMYLLTYFFHVNIKYINYIYFSYLKSRSDIYEIACIKTIRIDIKLELPSTSDVTYHLALHFHYPSNNEHVFQCLLGGGSWSPRPLKKSSIRAKPYPGLSYPILGRTNRDYQKRPLYLLFTY